MSYRKNMEQAESFEAKITAALERQPVVDVPEGFAARVAAQRPVVRPVRMRRPMRVGRTVAVVMGALTLVALTVMAPHVEASFANTAFDVEMVLVVELALVAGWLGLKWQDI